MLANEEKLKQKQLAEEKLRIENSLKILAEGIPLMGLPEEVDHETYQAQPSHAINSDTTHHNHKQHQQQPHHSNQQLQLDPQKLQFHSESNLGDIMLTNFSNTLAQSYSPVHPLPPDYQTSLLKTAHFSKSNPNFQDMLPVGDDHHNRFETELDPHSNLCATRNFLKIAGQDNSDKTARKFLGMKPAAKRKHRKKAHLHAKSSVTKLVESSSPNEELVADDNELDDF